MALALSLSLDLFLMKGNLFIAVREQPVTDGRTQGERVTNGGGAKEKEGRTEGRG